MRIIVHAPYGHGRKVCWLDPNKIKTIRDLLKFLRATFGEDDPITGVKLAEHDAEIQDIKILRDGDVLKILYSNDMAENNDDWVTFNVGGCKYSTFRSTIMANAPQSFLARLLSRDEKVHCRRDNEGAFLIDRSPKYFEVLLNCLRNGHLDVPTGMCKQGLVREALFYGIENEPLARLRKEFESKQVAGKNEWITFNVRGRKFQTYRSTILNYNYSPGMTSLADMINDSHPMCKKDVDGCYLLDRNPDAFQYVLEYLKRQLLYWPQALDSTYMYYECIDFGICDAVVKTLSPTQTDSMARSNPFRSSGQGMWADGNAGLSDMVGFRNSQHNNNIKMRQQHLLNARLKRNMLERGSTGYDLQDRSLTYQKYDDGTGYRQDDNYNNSLVSVDGLQNSLPVPLGNRRRHSDALLYMNRGGRHGLDSYKQASTWNPDLQDMNLAYQKAGQLEGTFRADDNYDNSSVDQIANRIRNNLNASLESSRGRRSAMGRGFAHGYGRGSSVEDRSLRGSSANPELQDRNLRGSSATPDLHERNLAYQRVANLSHNKAESIY